MSTGSVHHERHPNEAPENADSSKLHCSLAQRSRSSSSRGSERSPAELRQVPRERHGAGAGLPKARSVDCEDLPLELRRSILVTYLDEDRPEGTPSLQTLA